MCKPPRKVVNVDLDGHARKLNAASGIVPFACLFSLRFDVHITERW